MRQSLLPGLLVILALAPVTARAATYDVGPGGQYAAIGDVPWEALAPGDTVTIAWRQQPYREKWFIGAQGTAQAPVTVRGIPGPGGELPVIDGSGATTRPQLNYWAQTRGVIKVGGSNVPPDRMPRYVVIEDLEIRGARSTNSFTAADGTIQAYQDNASTIYVEKGEHVTVRRCILHDSGNGFFVASSDIDTSRDILVEGNFIYDNGNPGSIYEHNSYTAAIGIVFQYNRFGPLCAGCGGNNLKDRSAGLVVRYNWLEGGNRQLDLVNGEDSVQIRDDPAYHAAHVYGNVLIEPEGAGNRQVVHYGGDTGGARDYRKGTLYFFNNTVVSGRTDRTTLFRLTTGDERADARNNIVYLTLAAGTTLSLLDTDGVLDWSHNWLEPGHVISFGSFHGTVNDDGTSLEGSSPGFADEASQDFGLTAGSPCRDAGAPLNPLVLPDHALQLQYRKHQAGEPRPVDATLDIGAFEFAAAPPAVSGLGMAEDRQTITWSAVPGASGYDLVRGALELLLASRGDFAASLVTCLVNDRAQPAATDSDDPPRGGGFYYLVRATTSGGTPGTYDADGPGQVGSRDAAIQSSPGACP